MKKSLILMSLLMAATGGFARTLTPEEALQRVNNDNDARRVIRQDVSTIVSPHLLQTVSTSSGMPAVYLFGRSGGAGLMLVSADDVAMPLLGYCDAPEAVCGGELPPSMQWWLSELAAEIEYASAAGAPKVLESADVSGVSASFAPISPLCDTKWNQDAPYNGQCPLINGEQTYTGCLATALAQVMKYHEWPERGTGSVTYKDNNGTMRSMNFDVAFDWANMLDVYGSSSTVAQNDAVAQLMKACGYGVHMTYGTQASGASDMYVPEALTTYFGYDEGVRLCQRKNYGLAEWQNMVYDNLKNVGPVLYCGSSHLGGHAFVCDGYSSDGYFHFNWGWGGSYDGYFLLTALNPAGEGIGGYAGGYNLFQSITLGIRKPGGVPAGLKFQLSQSEPLTAVVSGNNLTLRSSWWNESGRSMTFALGIRLEPVDGTGGGVMYVDSDTYANITLDAGYGWNNGSFTFNIGVVPEGTYRVSLVTKNPAMPAQGWIPTLHLVNLADYVVLKKGAGQSVAAIDPGTLTIESAELVSELYKDCYAKLSMKVANNSELEVAESLAPVLVSGNAMVAAAGGIFFDLLPGESADRELVFDFAYTQAFKTNTNYTLCLYNPETNEVRHVIATVKVLDKPGTLRLSATSFTLEGGALGVDCSKNLCFTTGVKCLAGYMAMPITVVITPRGGGETLAYADSAEPLFLTTGQSGTAEISLPFTQGVPGSSYTAFAGYVDGGAFVQLRSMDFTVGLSGVETVSVPDRSGIEISYDRGSRMLSVSSIHGIRCVRAIAASGAEIAVPVSLSGETGLVDFSGVAGRIVIVTAVDGAGETETVKIVL